MDLIELLALKTVRFQIRPRNRPIASEVPREHLQILRAFADVVRDQTFANSDVGTRLENFYLLARAYGELALRSGAYTHHEA